MAEFTGSTFDAFQTITVSTIAIGLTVATIDRDEEALVTVETQPVRFRFDGTDPTSTVGHLLAANDILKLNSRDQLSRVRFIRSSAATGDATLQCSYGQV